MSSKLHLKMQATCACETLGIHSNPSKEYHEQSQTGQLSFHKLFFVFFVFKKSLLFDAFLRLGKFLKSDF